jgi:hypothetical protein
LLSLLQPPESGLWIERLYSNASTIQQLVSLRRLQLLPQAIGSIWSALYALPSTIPLLKMPNSLLLRSTISRLKTSFLTVRIRAYATLSILQRITRSTASLLICSCKWYNSDYQILRQDLDNSPLTLPLLLHTRRGIDATLAFISRTRVGTRKWYLGLDPGLD